MGIKITGWAVAVLVFTVVLILIFDPWRSSENGNLSVDGESLTLDSTPSLKKVGSIQKNSREEQFPTRSLGREKLDHPSLRQRQPSKGTALPHLSNSDRFVRSLIREIPVSDPRISGWLEQEDLISLLSEVLVTFSNGQVPRFVRLLLKPNGTFLTTELDEEYFIASANYARFDSLVEMLVAFDSDSVAKVMRTCEPLFSEALINLGSQESFRGLLIELTKEVSTTPLLHSDIMLIRPNVLYVFKDPKLESLSPLQKQLLRIGPINIQKIQNYLDKLILDLGIDRS